jgi:RimJ/RimL family protein N-acetyltransferase
MFCKQEKKVKHIIAYEGNHVALGLMQEAYVPLYLPWINKRTGIEGTLQRPPMSHAVGVEWIRSLDTQKGKNEVFAVLMHKGKSYEYAGHMAVHDIKWPDGVGKTGSIIGHRAARGRGIGTEAKLLLLYHAFEILGLRKIVSDVKTFNGQSLGHLLKCGYRPVGRYRKHVFHEGRFVDEILLEIFRDDWYSVWKAYQKTKALPKLSSKDRAWVSQTVSS